VLHHLVDTEGALSRLIDKLRPGGKIRIYVYWKRHGWRGWLLRSVILARRITTKLPFALLRGICWLISVFLYGAVIIPYRLLMRLGVPIREDWPLFVYSKYPFRVLYNDQFDRFSAPIEKRYDANEVLCLLESAGLQDVRVRASFGWIADGTKPS